MSKYVRKFQVKLEGQDESILISSLSASQTEEYLLEQENAKSEESDLTKRSKRLQENIKQLVVNALNNARAQDEPAWDKQRIMAEFDKQQLDAIFDKAAAVSGLVFPNLTAPTAA